MTFSQEVKSEILRSARKLQGVVASAFLTAVLKSSGSLTLSDGGWAFTLDSDNLEFLTVCQTIAREQLNAEVSILTREKRVKSERAHTCTFETSVGEKLGLIRRDRDGSLTFNDVTDLIPFDVSAKRGFMQGLFVAAGSVVIPLPEKDDQYSSNTLNTNYHLELRFTDDAFAAVIADSYPELEFHFLSRKSNALLYIKDSEKIADFLVYVNATKAKFTLEDVIISRSVRNQINRQKNCDVANIGKTVTAAGKQLAAIAKLRQMGVFDGLPDQLKDIALLREKYNEATLDEIADMLNISKSGANHRFAKLIELAQRTN